jgi:soluble lytic murein transglycosylase-like protein
VPFAVAAYNAGIGGALQGHAIGDVDRFTTGRDYSAWVMRHRIVVQHWLDAHPAWKPEG